MTLDDLISKGVEIRAQRIAEERERERAEHERVERERAEATERILALLPEPVRPLAEVEFTTANLDCARARIVAKGGEVVVYFEREGRSWFISSDDYRYRRIGVSTYNSRNSSGFFQRFFSFEEALAYAAGAFEV